MGFDEQKTGERTRYVVRATKRHALTLGGRFSSFAGHRLFFFALGPAVTRMYQM